MRVVPERSGGALFLKTEGRVDGTNAHTFHENIKKAVTPDDKIIILDLEELEYISSAGLRIILLVAKRQPQSGCQLCSLRAEQTGRSGVPEQRLRPDNQHSRHPRIRCTELLLIKIGAVNKQRQMMARNGARRRLYGGAARCCGTVRPHPSGGNRR